MCEGFRLARLQDLGDVRLGLKGMSLLKLAVTSLHQMMILVLPSPQWCNTTSKSDRIKSSNLVETLVTWRYTPKVAVVVMVAC